MKQYHDLMERILDTGIQKGDRTGTGTLSVFGHQMRFNLQEGFPLVTTKRVFWRGVVEELLWMLRGETNVRSLQERGVTIWDEWADENGELGPVYGAQWRDWSAFRLNWLKNEYDRSGVDQIAKVIEQIRTNPDSRRMIVSAWNPADVDSMALPPCHMMFQFYTRPMPLIERLRWLRARDGEFEAPWAPQAREIGGDALGILWEIGRETPERSAWVDEKGAPSRFLDCQLYQRSADVFLGVPFNIASYALLTSMIAHVTGLEPGEFVWTGGDTHLYLNHIEQAKLQLTREPRPLPRLTISDRVTTIDGASFEDFTLTGYDPHPAIRAEVSV